MLKQHSTLFRRLMMTADIVIASGACLLSYWILSSNNDHFSSLRHYSVSMVVMVVIWSAGLYYSGMYTSVRLKKASDILFIIYQTAYIGLVVFAAFCYLFHITDISRALVVVSFAFIAGFLVIGKLTLIMIFRFLRRKGFNYRNVLVIGTGPRAQNLIKSLVSNKELGLSITGILDKDKTMVGEFIHDHEVIGTIDDLPRITRENVIDQVFFVVPRSWLDDMEEPLLFLEKLGIRVDFAIDHFNLALTHARQSEFFGIPFLSVETTPDSIIPLAVKRLMDI
ncbi:MAG: sugar transferase, partial [Candidatus Omnitrophota bacterium]